MYLSKSYRPHSREKSRLPVVIPSLDGEHLSSTLRIKEEREERNAFFSHEAIKYETKNQESRRKFLFHTRWNGIRSFLIEMTETLEKKNLKNDASLYGLNRMWLRKLLQDFHEYFVQPMVSIHQIEIALNRSVGIDICSVPYSSLHAHLKHMLQSFENANMKVDYREVACALLALDRWNQGEKIILTLWFQEFAMPREFSNEEISVLSEDLKKMLYSLCESDTDEKELEPFVKELRKQCVTSMKSTQREEKYILKSTFDKFLDNHPILLEVIKRLCWTRLNDDTRLAFYKKEYEKARLRAVKAHAKIQLQNAVNLWKLREPRMRLSRWKKFTSYYRQLRRGYNHFICKKKIKGLDALAMHVLLKQHAKELKQIAYVQYKGTLMHWTFQSWKRLLLSYKMMYLAALRRSNQHHNQFLKKHYYEIYVSTVEAKKARRAGLQGRIERFQEKMSVKLLINSLFEWKEFHRLLRESNNADLRQKQINEELKEQRRVEMEVALMTIEDTIGKAIQKKELEAQELARKRHMKMQTELVIERRKLKRQVEDRTYNKRQRDEQILAEMEKAWNEIEKKVCIKVRESTIIWFDSNEGRAKIAEEANKIFEADPVDIQKQLLRDPNSLSLPGCRWQLKLEDYGGRYAKAFYLNVETFEKFMCDNLVMGECEAIAKEIIIQLKIDEAKARVKSKAAETERARQENEAAKKIQMIFRSHQALKEVRNIIRARFIKRVDPNTGDPVYFNISRRETRRRPPRLIGSEEHLIPVESSTWVRRMDDEGNTYYMNQETDESAWEPPKHYIMCSRCQINFVIRRWNESGSRFCINCYAEGMHKNHFPENATWTKLVVQPAKCIVCRNRFADMVCHECKGDSTCTPCFSQIHRIPKLSVHKKIDSLVEGRYSSLLTVHVVNS
jgi:hypothetical protein